MGADGGEGTPKSMTKTSLLFSDINVRATIYRDNRSMQSTNEAALRVHRCAATKD
jgi:hypothetical protein